ncbi:MAG: hypothetical protein ACRDZQ_01775 [Acidimicrobiales bacterium]
MRGAARRAAALCGALALAVGLAACSKTPDQTGSLAQRVRAWASGTGYAQEVAALQADVARIEHDRKAAKPKVVQFDCITLGQDATKDNSQLVTPDKALSQDLSDAYNAFYSYASACVAHSGAPAVVAGADHYLAAGDRALASARARMQAIVG